MISHRVKLVMSAALLLIAGACSGDAASGPPERLRNVALIMKASSGDYWESVGLGAEAAAKELGVNLHVAATHYEGDVDGQIQLIDKFMKEGMDALVIAANDYNALGKPVDNVAAKRIPVISIDSRVASDKVRSFIGINHYEAGQKAGAKLVELAGERSRIAIVGPASREQNSAQREQGLRSAIADHPGVKVVRAEYCPADLRLCREKTDKLLREAKELDGIVALDALSSISVAAVAENMNLAGKVKIVAFDKPSSVIEYLQDGVVQGTIIQNPFSIGYLGVKYAVDAIKGGKLPEFTDTGTKVIDRENMFWSDNQKLLFPFVK